MLRMCTRMIQDLFRICVDTILYNIYLDRRYFIFYRGREIEK